MDARRKQLLDAIAAAPESDAERLVYADWLIESSGRVGGLEILGELGELIVAQVSQAARPDDPALTGRVAQLISAHQSEVLGDLPLSKPVFRRGFVEAAEISADDFVRVAARVFERLPLLVELVIWLEREAGSERLFGSPALGRLRALTFRYGRSVDVAVLARNAALAELEALAWIGCEIGSRGCQGLADSPHLGSLRALELGSDELRAAGVRALAGASFAPRLRELGLRKSGLDVAAIEQLQGFVALETLELGFNGLELGAVEALVALAPTLRSLSLRGNRIGAPAVSALAPLTLSHLDLGGVRIGDAGVSQLAALELGELETLELDANRVGVAGIQRLIELSLPKLRHLSLRNNDLGERGRGLELLQRNLRATRVELDGMVLLAGR